MNVISPDDTEFHIFHQDILGNDMHFKSDSLQVIYKAINMLIAHCREHDKTLADIKYKLMSNNMDERCLCISIGTTLTTAILYKLYWN